MSEMSWERTAEARAALTAIVSDPEYGVAALSSPRTMSNLLKDLLPDAPREKTVLVAAAEAGLAETLRDHAAQGVDSTTAVRLTASQFAANTSFTPEACSWVAGEFAIALGISQGTTAGPVASPPGPSQFSPGPVAPPPGPAQYPPGPSQFSPGPVAPPPGPAQYPPGPSQFSPGPVVSPPGPAQYPPGPSQFSPGPVVSPPGPGQYPPGPSQFSPGPVVSPPGPGQFAPGSPQFMAGQPGYSPAFGQPRPKNNSLAVTAMICGLSQILLWIFVVPGVLALIFGLVSLRQINRTGEAGRGMAITGVVLGALGLFGLLLLVIIAASVGSHTTQ